MLFTRVKTLDLLIFISSLLTSTAFASPPVKVGVKAGVLDGILGAGIFVQSLLLLLIFLSITSWAVIFTKWRQLKSVRANDDAFLERFWKAPSLESMNDRLSDFPSSILARVFKAAFGELQKIADSGLAQANKQERVQHLRGLDNLERSLRKASDTEISNCEAYLSFLATTGSTAPFIGLLGTVVGIMTSFSSIAASGSANLAVVAPGISEALFATAMGLVAALPAVAAYNYFVGQIRKIEMELNNFSSDFLNISKRNFFHEG